MAGYRGTQSQHRRKKGQNSSLLTASFTLDNVNIKHTFSGLAVMSAEKMAATDSYNKCLILFSANGTVTSRVGKGKLRGPMSVTTNRNEWLVSDSGVDKRRVVVYDDTGRYLREFPTIGISQPGPISASDCFVAVIDMDSPKIVIYNTNGTKFSQITTTLTEKDNRFQEFTSYEMPPPTDFINPESCAFGSDDKLCVTFGAAVHIIKCYQSTGEYIGEMEQWKSACGIHITARGNILIADREDKKVDIRNISGNTVRDAVLSPATGLNLQPHHISVLEGNRIVLTVAPNMFSAPNIVQIFQL